MLAKERCDFNADRTQLLKLQKINQRRDSDSAKGRRLVSITKAISAPYSYKCYRIHGIVARGITLVAYAVMNSHVFFLTVAHT